MYEYLKGGRCVPGADRQRSLRKDIEVFSRRNFWTPVVVDKKASVANVTDKVLYNWRF